MVKFDTFSELVNGTIIQEDAHLAHKAEKKRKAPAAGSSSGGIFEQRSPEVPSGTVGSTESPFSAPATTVVGIHASSVHSATGDSQASCPSVE